MTVDKKLLIKLKVFNQIWWSWCHYNEEKMLYPAKWKNNCSSEQSSKELTVPFLGGPPTNEKFMANPENDSP